MSTRRFPPAPLARQERVSAPRRALLGFVLLVAILSGCSATQFIYNRVDILIRWYLDDYVSLDRDQQARFTTRLDALLEWHRLEELPVYVMLRW